MTTTTSCCPITNVKDDATLDEVKDLVTLSETTVLLACASFVTKCQPLLTKIKSSLSTDIQNGGNNGGCCGTSSSSSSSAEGLSILVINTDDSDDLEELAIELGLTAIPSFNIYRKGTLILSSGSDDVTYSTLLTSLKTATTTPPPPTSCSNPPPNNVLSNLRSSSTLSSSSAPAHPDDIRQLVSSSYATTISKDSPGGCCVSVDSTLMGYSPEDLLKAGAEANLGLGCGNPLSFANLQPGETVVDLGSGAGIDCFIAGDKVGPDGIVIGVDMTPDMIHAARRNARAKNVTNVSFRLGEIEYLPVGNDVADVVVSNCVINLSPDKEQVFREIYRVLKPGGRLAVSDVITRENVIIPERLKTAEALAC